MSTTDLQQTIPIMSQYFKKKKKAITEKDLLLAERRRILAKFRFRALAQRVIANHFWLVERQDYEGVDNVKLKIEQAVRGTKKSVMTLEDRVLLNKPVEDRTYDEKSYLSRKYKGLKCFKFYPQAVRKHLAAVTRFEYFGPGRVIIKENHEPYALYFILSGKVVVTQAEYDRVIEKYKDVEIKVLGQGDYFGEISLLHNIRRTATVTTVDHSEFLVLRKDDFEHILKGTIQKIWDEVFEAMSLFSYFDTLDEMSLQEGCSLGKLLNFEPNETILGDGRGVHNFVYFVLTGRTEMIESLKIIVTIDHVGRTRYTLYDPYVEKEESEKDIMLKLLRDYSFLKDESVESESDDLSGILPNRGGPSTLTATAAASAGVILKRKSKVEKVPAQTPKERSSFGVTQTEEGASIFHVPPAFKTRNKPRPPPLVQIPEKQPAQTRSTRVSEVSARSCRSSTLLLPPIDDDPYARESIMYASKTGGVASFSGKMRTYFMKVCEFKGGSTFGLGENFRDRRIVAMTKVSCLVLPYTWLMRRNTANIWTRIKHYLNKKIPNKKKLFEKFVNQRRWEEYRQQIVKDIYKRRQRVEHFTLMNDVPYCVRLEEISDIAYI